MICYIYVAIARICSHHWTDTIRLTKLASSAQPSSSSSLFFFQIKRSRRIMRTADDGDKLLQHR
jgi:hypothetical protein